MFGDYRRKRMCMLGGSTNTSQEQEDNKEVYAWLWFNNQSINQIINLRGKLEPLAIYLNLFDY